jgi:predicted enzyme related to lactoylglutathione lyase
MSSVLHNITFDCADSGAVARFWAAVTGWDLHDQGLRPGGREYSVRPPDGELKLYFTTVPEPKAAKNRVHLDIKPVVDQRAEIERLVRLGASIVTERSEEAGWVVMSDPEGNEFCIEPSD